MRRRIPLAVLAAAAVALTSPVSPARADHTDPNGPLVPIVPVGDESLSFGEGTWEHIASFGGTTGTDLKYFHRDGSIYVSAGQLGQADPLIVGQRLIRLTNADGEVVPEHVADHGSGHCGDVSNVSATTGLQHDAAVTPRVFGTDLYDADAPKPDAELILDTVDAVGRCHDAAGGGLELIDISGLGTEGFEPREVHLTRHTGYSHTVTVDATRPWIVYNSSSDFGVDPDGENPMGIGKAWIDVLDIRSCLGLTGQTLDAKRAACRPEVFRIPFEYDWAAQQKEDGSKRQPSACHDITARPGKIYCAAPTSTMAFDVSGLTTAQGPSVPAASDPAGDIKGTPLPCNVVDAVPAANTGPTAAKVTDCTMGVPNDTALAVAAYNEAGRPAAEGWEYVGHVNHAGRECNAPNGASTCNSNLQTRADEGIAIAHESDPSPDGKHLFVTDERGGGIVPPGATCAPSLDNPYGNGGLHVFDMTKKDAEGRFTYAQNTDGDKAIYISQSTLPTPTFCTIHVIEQIPDEQRLIVAWYSQGVKVLDYFIDEAGRFSFEEVAGFALLPNDIWVSEVFKIVDNPDKTRTYFFTSNDVGRGVDVFSWTGPTNLIAAAPPATPPGPGPRPAPAPRPVGPPMPATGMDYAVLALAGALVPAALVLRRRRLARAA